MIFREAEIADSIQIAHIKVATWRSTYRGIFPNEILDNMDEKSIDNKWNQIISQYMNNDKMMAFVCEVDGIVVGYTTGNVLDSEYDIEIMAIYVLKEYQGRGIGRELIKRITGHFSPMGYESMIIWVIDGNPYAQFYERLGGKPLDSKLFESWGESYNLLGYVWSDIGLIA